MTGKQAPSLAPSVSNDAVGANAGRDLPHKRCRFAALDPSGESFPTAAQNAEGAGPLSPGTAQQLQTKRCGQKWDQEHIAVCIASLVPQNLFKQS